MNEKLAMFGGKKTFDEKVVQYNTIGKEELQAATKVIKSGKLSSFLGENSEEFYGGYYVRKFEKKLEKFFNVKHAITVNSWTSGLSCAVGALDLEPGSEIILPSMTMCACASAIIQWNLIPVFADIDRDNFTIDPTSIEKKITKKTRAIMTVDYLGQSADMKRIRKIAKKNNLKIISDSAQAIGSKYNKKFAGTMADIGGFSLNYHKLIHTGEGGVLVTDNSKLATRLKLIRNHGEAVVEGMKIKNISNIIGRNYRMGEIEAAIGIEQLKKLKNFVKEKRHWANILIQGLKNLQGLKLPITNKNTFHSYYAFPMMIDPKITGVSRDKILKALNKEGVPWLSGKLTLIHKLPMFRNKIAFGKNNFPWSLNGKFNRIDYKKKNICPVTEKIMKENFINLPLSLIKFDKKKLQKIVKSFEKVWKNLDKLKKKK